MVNRAGGFLRREASVCLERTRIRAYLSLGRQLILTVSANLLSLHILNVSDAILQNR